MLDISGHVTCHIVLLEDPINSREDNQHVCVYLMGKNGLIPKSIESAFHMDEWA